MSPRVRSRLVVVILLTIALTMTTSCSWVSGWFGDDDPAKPTDTSVFDAQIGDCFLAPETVKTELAALQKVPCDVDHQQELYAQVGYDAKAAAGAVSADTYPGDTALDSFAQGACAQRFADYVGIAYPDSGLWMTYLMPSARSWQQDKDRTILCFVTTTGDPLTQSVQGSKL